MRAFIVPELSKLAIMDIPKPVIGDYEALVRIEVCGICNSTDHKLIEGTMFWAPPFPLVLGHESVGVVVECGSKVATFKPGDRVTRPIYIAPPGTDAPNPASGGFAEFGVVRDLAAMLRDGDRSFENDYNALRQRVVPEGIDAVEAALAISFAETASVLRHLPDVRGHTVVVAGTGGAGLMFGLWLKLGGAKVITLGRRRQRLDKALSLGADAVVSTLDPDWLDQVRALAGGPVYGMIEATGDADMASRLVTLLAPDGFASAYGVPPTGTHYPAPWQEATVAEHIAYGWVFDLMKRGWVKPEWFVTHTWTLDQAAEAFELACKGEVLKGFIRCS